MFEIAAAVAAAFATGYNTIACEVYDTCRSFCLFADAHALTVFLVLSLKTFEARTQDSWLVLRLCVLADYCAIFRQLEVCAETEAFFCGLVSQALA